MTTLALILLMWLPLCIAVGILAQRYNRFGFGWFLFAVLLSPLLGFAFVLACGPRVAPAPSAPTKVGPGENTGVGLPAWAERRLPPDARRALVEHHRRVLNRA